MDGRLLDEKSVMRLAFVTEDLDRTTEWLMDLFGLPATPVHDFPPDEVNTIYRGSRGHRLGCQIRFWISGISNSKSSSRAGSRAPGGTC